METVEIPINDGTLPDWNTRLGYPQATNMYVGESGYLYCNPGLVVLSALPGLRNFRFTPYNGGAYIAVTRTAVVKITLSGVQSLIANIIYSGQNVEIDENLKNQVAIADGLGAYVYDQAASTFTKLGVPNGFGLANPISVACLNSFMIWLDLSGVWLISNPNDALTYNPLNINQIDSALVTPRGLGLLRNNLFIFGSADIERWEPTLSTNDYLFPFQKDTNFRVGFGVLSSASITNAIDRIYFLSSKFVPMQLTPDGLKDIPEGKPLAGMARIISQYPDVTQAAGAFYSFRGNYFYQLTFPEEGIGWIYNEKSKTFSLTDDLITCSSINNEVIGTTEGLFSLSLTIPVRKKREWISRRIVGDKNNAPFRNLINGFEPRIVQGYPQVIEPQFIELTISKDSQQWLDSVPAQIGFTGQRQARTLWQTNIATSRELTVKLRYYGTLNFTIEKFMTYIT